MTVIKRMITGAKPAQVRPPISLRRPVNNHKQRALLAATMQQAHRVLNEVFGYDNFRLSQEKVWAFSKLYALNSHPQVIGRLLEDNKNALVVFPTGGEHSRPTHLP